MADMVAIASRLEAVATRLENVAVRGGGGGAAVAQDDPEFLAAYATLIKGEVQAYVDLSKKVGGLVEQQAGHVLEGFKIQYAFLEKVARCKQPDPATIQKLLQPTSASVDAVQQVANKGRGDKLFNHITCVKEGIGALGWVTVMPKPAPYLKEMSDQALFYGNRVIKDYKGKDETHIEWMRSYITLLKQLTEHVKDFHGTGISWNPQGGNVSAATAAAPPPPPPGGAPPPPPGPPPPPVPSPSTGSAPPAGPEGDKNALFASINKGADVTKGLRKVTNDMKTHKNPELRQAGGVGGKPGQKPAPSPKPGAAPAKPKVKDPVFQLEGKKWLVEHHVGNKELKISDAEMKHTVYVFKCVDSVLQIDGKVNSVVVDGCKKVAVVLNDLVSGLEFVNSQSIQCQILGKVPTISIDKTDGCQIYLSEGSVKAEIVTAKSSEMNILVPDGKGEFSEHALPEQYKSSWNGSKFVTEMTDINN